MEVSRSSCPGYVLRAEGGIRGGAFDVEYDDGFGSEASRESNGSVMDEQLMPG